jgi:hypothetical protein
MSSLGPEIAREPTAKPAMTRYVRAFMQLVTHFTWGRAKDARGDAIAASRRRAVCQPRRWLVHRDIAEAAIARQADKAVKLLEDHITEATRLIVAGLLVRGNQKSAQVQQRKAASRRQSSA